MIELNNNRKIEFLKESNLIENVSNDIALDDAISAFNYLIEKDRLTKENILRTHAILLGRIDNKIAGRFRKGNVSISCRNAPDWSQVDRMINNWIYGYSESSTEDMIKKAHIEFEYIHPFYDGNGRIGRIIMNWQRLKNNFPLLVIYAKNRLDYYKWFEDLL